VNAFAESLATTSVPRPGRTILRDLMHRPVAALAIAFLATLVLASIAAPLIAPYSPVTQDLTRTLTGPSAHNLLGTDELGRDVLSRLIYGGRRSLLSIAEGLSIVLVLGVPLGLAAGYVGGWTDWLLSRIAEIVLSMPTIILILVVLAVLPQNESAAMIAFGVLNTPSMLRVVRAATLKVREELYVTAARLSGLSHVRIAIRHILPRIAGPIIVQGSIFAAYALLFETGLAFLGLTATTSTPTWGGMVGDASTVILQDGWLIFPPGIVIALTILSLGVLGDAVRDVAVRDVGPAGKRRRASAAPAIAAHGVPDAVISSRSEGLLQVRNLTVALEDEGQETLVVDNLSFDVFPGETLGLVGESGCGKSVTAMALLRLLPSALRPVSGHVYWENDDLLEMTDRGFDRLRGSTIAFVSQEPQSSLDPTFRIGSQLVEVIRSHERLSRSDARRRALELLELVELPDAAAVARAYAHELSGGMAQRVALALALAGRPRLLIADEPTTALDVTVQAEILALLRRLQVETGLAILVITHNWGVVADICDRTLVMYAGQIVEQADVQEMFDRPLHPYTLALLQSHPAQATAGERLSIVGGRVPPPGSRPVGCRFAARCRFATEECAANAVPLLNVAEDRLSRCIRVDEVFAEAAA
jgi:peptide/nickel transport system permease protein